MAFTDPPYVPPIDTSGPVADAARDTAVTVATVLDPAALPNVGTMTNPPDGMLLGYGQTIDYGFDMGLRPQAVAASSASAVVGFSRIHTGTCSKTITAVALAVGMDAPIPHWNTNSANDVLISKRIVAFSPGKTMDGSQVNGVLVVYSYALQQMPSVTDQLDRGSTSIDAQPPAMHTLNPSTWLTTLIGPAAPVSGAPGTPITY